MTEQKQIDQIAPIFNCYNLKYLFINIYINRYLFYMILYIIAIFSTYINYTHITYITCYNCYTS